MIRQVTFGFLISMMSSCLLLSTAIYLLHRLTSLNLTTRCLAVTGGGSVDECSSLSQSNSFWAHYDTTILTYLVIVSSRKSVDNHKGLHSWATNVRTRSIFPRPTESTHSFTISHIARD